MTVLHGMHLGLLHFMVASCAMVLAFVTCHGLHEINQIWLQQIAPRMHSVFLPFGVMILLGWVYGWLALPLILPAALLSVFWIVGGEAMTGIIVFITVVKVLSVPVTFALFRWGGMDVRGEGGMANWRGVVMVGLVASVLGNVPRATVGPFGGGSVVEMTAAMLTATAADVAGLIAVMLIVMLCFRLARRMGQV